MSQSAAAKIWYEQFDGKPQSPGWIITAYDKAITEAAIAMRERAAQYLDQRAANLRTAGMVDALFNGPVIASALEADASAIRALEIEP